MHSGEKKQLAVTGSSFCRAVSIVAFFNKIFAYQELFYLVTLLPSSIKHADDFGGNEKINTKSNRLNKRNKNSERAPHYLAAFFCSHRTTNGFKLDRIMKKPSQSWLAMMATFTESL